ncbi:DoxX family protein [Mycobacterium sp.]|uniref:DoxX family protein n=1 Tax=Mycobacterium sp. TaxID=1785 RepID=UPI0031D04493
MSAVESSGDAAAPSDDDHRPVRWHLLTRISFRFCVVYFGLFCLLFVQIAFVFTGVFGWWLPPGAVWWQMNALGPVTEWVGRHVFGIDAALHEDSRSGDQAANWVLMFTVLVVALTTTVFWSVLDRRRTGYRRPHAWFLVFLRVCLGGQMLYYGAFKVIPVQMPAPPLTVLLRPYGQLSPNSVLFLQVGSSYPYEIALGAVEVAAGALLFWPRTATLGALLAMAGMAQVFLMNMTFGVSVKILSFQLLLVAVVLLAPQARRLADVFILDRPSPPATQPALFTSRRTNKVAAAIQITLGAWVLIGCLLISGLYWHQYGDGAPKPEPYGIWSVTQFSLDGASLPPLTTQPDRWQRLIIDDPDTITYQRMNGELVPVSAVIDAQEITLFTARGPATLTIDRTAPDRLRLSGQLDGRLVTIALQRVDPNSFILRSRGFQWVQEYPDLYPGFK